MNRNYLRSRARELTVKKLFENQKWLSFRTAGSHGIADVVAIRFPKDCYKGNHFEVRLIQIKVSENLKKGVITDQLIDSPCGTVSVEYWKFPVKSRKWNKTYAKKYEKERKLKKKQP